MPDDYELLYLAKENNEDAIDILIKKYYNKIYYKAIKECSKLRDIDDFINEGIFCLHEAISNYNDNTKFSTYLNKVLDNKLINYRKSSERKKYSPLNEAILIDNYENINDKSLIDLNYNPELIIENEENYEELKKTITEKLSFNEELVLSLIEQNYTVLEISNITDIKEQKIYRLIRHIRLKVSKIM